MEGNWFIAFQVFIVLVVWGGIAACVWLTLMAGPDDRVPASSPKGKQVFWGLVLASLVVATTAWVYLSDISGAPEDSADRFYGDQFSAP